MQLFHRTSIPAARGIVQHGFEDESWGFGSDEHTGRTLTVQGVWLSDRPVSPEEGPPGDAVLEVELNLPESTLGAFEIRGVFDDARIWVIPAQLVNHNSNVRIGGVDARSSWFHEQVEEDGEGSGEDDQSFR